MNNEEKDSVFKDIFNNVNTWLHFAEAKNVALIVADIAIVTVLFSATPEKPVTLGFIVAGGFVVISIIFCLISFLPVLGKPAKEASSDEVNLLFFKDIASIKPDEYAKRVYQTYFQDSNPTVSPLHNDYGKEIVINSRITVRKLQLFNFALVFAVLGLGVFIIFLIIHIRNLMGGA